jgi:tRNA pseudouridine32 synthase/23S rRNA pseudouridine746 synthase
MQVLFDHEDFMVVAKPARVTMHQSSTKSATSSKLSTDKTTLDDSFPVILPLLRASLAQQTATKKLDISYDPATLHLVHRLDDHTSGCLIIAKHAIAAERFRLLFTNHKVQKYYVALSDTKGKRKQGWVKGDMVNKRRGQWALTKTMLHPAISYFFRQGLGNGLYLYWIKPFSGKTHQIRVALKSNSSTILGDTHYGGTPAQRMYLHAYALHFEYGSEVINVSCPVTDMEHAPNPSNKSLFDEPTISSMIVPTNLLERPWPTR